jgi:hypothetical protein
MPVNAINKGIPFHCHTEFSEPKSTEDAAKLQIARAKDDILIPVPKPYKVPEGYPLFGQWVPKEAFVNNWAGTEFVRRLLNEELGSLKRSTWSEMLCRPLFI